MGFSSSSWTNHYSMKHKQRSISIYRKIATSQLGRSVVYSTTHHVFSECTTSKTNTKVNGGSPTSVLVPLRSTAEIQETTIYPRKDGSWDQTAYIQDDQLIPLTYILHIS
ncbi:unnamed protein product [Rhizophagus irregularis]|nr:unnamed protein product [Rhizophagus irregularis]